MSDPGSPSANRAAPKVSAELTTKDLARVVVHHRRLPSTSDRALALSKAGARHGLAVIADEQTAGRGQRGRVWRSDPGAGLYVSFVLRTALAPARAALTTLAAGVAVCEGLGRLVDAPLGLKWPNDVLVAEPGPRYGTKLAGILFEAVSDQDVVHHAILGIGVNLRAPSDPALASFATSLEDLGADDPRNLEVLVAIANALDEWLGRLETGAMAAVTGAWSAAAMGVGQTVEIDQGDRRVRGELLGLSVDGALSVKTAEGVRAVYHGRLALPGSPQGPELR